MQIKDAHRNGAKINILRLSPLQTAGRHKRPAFFYAACARPKRRCRAADRSEKSGADIEAIGCKEQGHDQAYSAEYGNGFESLDFKFSSRTVSYTHLTLPTNREV